MRMKLLATLLGAMFACGIGDGDALRDEFMAWSTPKNGAAVSSCTFTGIEEMHGRDVIRTWLDIAKSGVDDAGPEGMEIGFKIMPIAFACLDVEDNGSEVEGEGEQVVSSE